jgi:dihydrofolate synthase / folylpolyglutamate synthase
MRSLAVWLEQQTRSHPRAIDLTLERVREVARRLDLLAPRHLVITVAGTNGKGSTVAYLDAVLRAHGLRCGRFTSPHLTRYNERICVDGVEATDRELIASFERIDAARGSATLTFFEYNALAAFDCFARRGVDAAVLEVGLGGRLDATNILDADVGVVCSIGFDHTDWLGDSLDAIGREKAGIFRAGRPAVLGSADLPRAVFDVIEAVGARAVVPGRDYSFRRDGDRWRFAAQGRAFEDLPLPALAGAHQVSNAATALAALVCTPLAVEWSRERIAQALQSVRLPGRFQRVPGEIEWVLDVAHNVPAAQELHASLSALPRRPTVAVYGILADKDARGITAVLAASVDAWIPVQLAGPRAVATDELAARLPAGAAVLAHARDVAHGCALARDWAEQSTRDRATADTDTRGARVLVFGSFLTVGPALEFLGL